jgi:hypothetical protein
MPILDLPTNPSRPQDPTLEAVGTATTGNPPPPKPGAPRMVRAYTAHTAHPIKVRTGRFGDLEEHELIHLLDALDDERARARFRESIYISVIVYLAIAWFLFYGPRVLFHQPQLQDPIALMKQHDKELTFIDPHPPALKPPPKPVIDRKTMEQLKKQAPVTPQPPTPEPPAPEQARNTPPAPQPLAPLPVAPKPSPSIDAPLPSAPRPNIAQNGQNPHDAMQSAMRGGRTGADVGAPGASTGSMNDGAEVLSDTQGVDFNAYIARVKRDLRRNWIPLIPEEAAPPISKRGITRIRFSILPGGEIGAMTLEGGSGDIAIDKAAWGAIISEGQFPPLPKEYHGPQLELRFWFFLNTPVQE